MQLASPGPPIFNTLEPCILFKELVTLRLSHRGGWPDVIDPGAVKGFYADGCHYYTSIHEQHILHPLKKNCNKACRVLPAFRGGSITARLGGFGSVAWGLARGGYDWCQLEAIFQFRINGSIETEGQKPLDESELCSYSSTSCLHSLSFSFRKYLPRVLAFISHPHEKNRLMQRSF
jgi:hypothetical protein